MRHGTGQSVGGPPLNLTSPSASLRVVRFSVRDDKGVRIVNCHEIAVDIE
jgi:hypothetical protein